ncbi:MAG: sulfite exporter TauE/SafE family protein [Candidatus Nanopelagicales bacterium]
MIIIVFALVGAAAQFVDGTLGMGFGVTSATLLTLLGYSAVAASAGTHAAKMGTTLVSGVSHWREGNVDWRVFLGLGVPGAVGAFVGAVILTNIEFGTARIWMSSLLFILGLVIIGRFGFGKSLFPPMAARARQVWPIGLVGGLVDATGGGGWGPVATPTMMMVTKHEPHRVVGTVNAAEFLVDVSASTGFLVGAGDSGIPWAAVGGLVLGGAISAPIAARLAKHAPRAILGVCVGGMVLISNLAVLAKLLEVPGALAGALSLVIVAATAVIARRAHRVEQAPRAGLPAV